MMSTLMFASALAGCASTAELPLVFGQTHTVGISMGASTTDQGGEFTLGYRDRNVAIVPVVMSSGASGATQLSATATGGFTDALSVLGQFEVNSDATARKIGLGKFFATGLAAKVLADGFSAQLSGQPEEEQAPVKVAAAAPQGCTLVSDNGKAAGN
jgi:hypothetical protein